MSGLTGCNRLRLDGVALTCSLAARPIKAALGVGIGIGFGLGIGNGIDRESA